MRFLFVKDHLAWPRSSGHDVHTFYLMQALARQGHEVHFLSVKPADADAVVGGGFTTHVLSGQVQEAPLKLSKWQEKFRSYWGIPSGRIAEIGARSKELNADVVSVVGLNVLPYLGAVENARRVWYAGDEWFWHHASQFQLWQRSTWAELKHGLIKGIYERAYSRLLDRVWMVSVADRRALAWVAGHRGCDVIPNGIDTDYFHPGNEAEVPASCVFWGRLDFGPNIQALQWFAKEVWPRVQAERADARFQIYGFQPTAAVEKLVESNRGFSLSANLPDIRPQVRQQQVVVLPFVSGGGIKNKLLEAAALGKAIVCTPRTVTGLAAGESVRLAGNGKTFAREVLTLWQQETDRQKLGTAARQWVQTHHTWDAAARIAVDGLTHGGA